MNDFDDEVPFASPEFLAVACEAYAAADSAYWRERRRGRPGDQVARREAYKLVVEWVQRCEAERAGVLPPLSEPCS